MAYLHIYIYVLFSRPKAGEILNFQLRSNLISFGWKASSTLSDTYQLCILVAGGSDCPTVPSTDGCCLMESIELPAPTFYKMRTSPVISQSCMRGFTVSTLLSGYKKDIKYYKQWWTFFAGNCPVACSIKGILSARCKQNYVIFFG